jgi:Alanyl-tRNA synthetase
MGGQVADAGNIYDLKGNQVAEVVDVQHAPNGQNIHLVNIMSELDVDTEYQLKIDGDFREKVRHNHTATHLLDQALRDVVSARTHQAGSLVEPDYLRFDFNSNAALTSEQISELEKIVNEKIWAAIPVKTEVLPIEEAKKKKGAIAMLVRNMVIQFESLKLEIIQLNSVVVHMLVILLNWDSSRSLQNQLLVLVLEESKP